MVKGVVNDCLSGLLLFVMFSFDGDVDNWGVGGGGIVNLFCFCLDSVDVVGVIVGNSMFLVI